jgi:hypothetical protein
MAVRALAERPGVIFDAYTPRRLRDLGVGELVREYPDTYALPQNPGLHQIGFSAWKPFIILHAAQSMQPDDIVFYLDSNITKYESYRDMIESIEMICEIALQKMDFYVGRQYVSAHVKNVEFSNQYQLDEIGRGTQFVRNFPLLIVNNIVIRKSRASEEILLDWLALCRVDRFIMPPLEHERHQGFSWFCPEQSVLNSIVARHIEEGLLPWWYPNIVFGRSNKMEVPLNPHVSYLASTPVVHDPQLMLRGQYAKEILSARQLLAMSCRAHVPAATGDWEDVHVPLGDWVAADDAVIATTAEGPVVIADGVAQHFHLMRIQDDRFENAEIELEIAASPVGDGSVGLNVQHWGGVDVCTFHRDGRIQRWTDITSEWLERTEGAFRCRVRFINLHRTISVGCGRPHGHYQGEGRAQFRISSIKVRRRSMR